MKTIVNFRSFVIIALVMTAAVFAARLVLSSAAIGIVVLAVIIFATGIVAFVLKRKGAALYKQVTFIAAAAMATVAAVVFIVVAVNWIPAEINDGKYRVNAQIEKNYIVDGKNYIVLRNLSLNNENVNGKMLVRVNNEKTDFYETPVGYSVSFESYVKVKNVIGENSEYNYSSFSSNVRYAASVNATDVVVGIGKASFLDKIYMFVSGRLVDNLGAKNGYVAYGMLSGDKYAITDEVSDAFSAVGIAHILAVSGLHIGFLTTALFFILKLFKVKKLPSFITTAVVLLLYATFAGFSPSVIRACFMCLVGSGAVLLGEEKDILNALGFAVTAIVLVAPQMLFTAGMVMSVFAVFGLTVFVNPINMFLSEKCRLPETVSQSLSASIGAQLGVMPATIYYFGNIQTYSVVANVLLMPIISVAFTAVFLSVILSIVPFLSFTIKVSGFFVNILVELSSAIATLKFASVAAKSGRYIFLIYPLYFLGTGYVNVKRKKSVYCICYGIIILLIVFSVTIA